jgi:vacuolar-type H+-ATPase subunit F/Vma7
MGAIAVLGEAALIRGYGLAGALEVVAEEPEQARRAFAGLPPGVALVVLTPMAAESVSAERDCANVLTVVMPS